MKKRIFSLLLCAAMVLGLATAAFAANPTDVAEDAPYYDSVQYCIENGLMVGVSDTTFDPEGTITRAQIVSILYRLEGKPALMNANIFTDVPAGSWYEKPVVWAQGKGIVSGYGDGTFHPTTPINREQMAVIIYKYAQYKGVNINAVTADTNTLSYEDIFTVSSWASSAMHFCLAAGLFTADLGGNVLPKAPVSRAETAVIISRAGALLGQKPAVGPVAGGWTLNADLGTAEMPEEAQAAFDQATAGMLGAKYVPVAYLGSQVVAGVNYAYLCKITTVTAEPATKLAVVKVYRDLSGNAEILNINEDVASCVDSEGGVEFNPADFAGGWTVSEACGGDMDKNAQSAFDKAFKGMLGVGYTPLACLGTQVVAGTNYAILCKAATVTAEPKSALAVAVVYFDLSGNAEILSINGFTV